MISIVVPLYNKMHSIANTITSVLEQTYSNFEVVIVDDGSTDNSLGVISKTFSDSRIRVINQKNAGVSAARNAGVRAATADWIVFLDADDLMLPNCLDTLMALQLEYNTDVVSANFYNETESKTQSLRIKSKYKGIVKELFYAYYTNKFTLRTGCAMISKTKLITNLYPEHLSRYEDLCWALEILKTSTIAVSPTPVLIYTCDYKELSHVQLKNINKDFSSHLIFKGKSFWERLIYGKLILHNLYAGVPRKIYSDMYGANFYLYVSLTLFESKIKKILDLCSLKK